MAEDPKKHTILMFPFMAQVHLVSFVALALNIERTKKKCYDIALINTPENIKIIRSYLPTDSSIRLLEISVNSSVHPGLPPIVDDFCSLPRDHMIRLIEASLFFSDPFRELVSDLLRKKNGESRVCVIADRCLVWMGSVCKELGVYFAIFSSSCGFGMASFHSYWLNHTASQGDGIFLEDLPEAGKLHKTKLGRLMIAVDRTDAWSVFLMNSADEWKNADAILFNTVEELDQLGISYFRRNLGLPIWAIGPVQLSTENKPIAGPVTEDLKRWLDRKPAKSVLFISFGTTFTISPANMMNLAMALEASGKRFIWVIRPPTGFDRNEPFRAEEWLPEGYPKRMFESGRGIVVQRLSAEVDILHHKSISVFMSNCGWKAVVESLSRGVPLLGWPMVGEQFFNWKFLEEEIRVCIEVAKGINCVVRSEDLVSKINLAMGDNERGRGIRRKAEEVRKMMKRAMEKDGPSTKAMDEFLTAAVSVKIGEDGDGLVYDK